MYRVELVLGVLTAVVWIFSLVSCIMTPESEVRGIPKWAWLISIVLLPLLGSILWLGVGRVGGVRLPRAAGSGAASVRGYGPPARRDYSSLTSDERIRRMEEDLARLERESDEGGDGTGGATRPRG